MAEVGGEGRGGVGAGGEEEGEEGQRDELMRLGSEVRRVSW